MYDQNSVAKEIHSVACEYVNDAEVWATMSDVARCCVCEIVTSITATPERIVELWNASGLTY